MPTRDAALTVSATQMHPTSERFSPSSFKQCLARFVAVLEKEDRYIDGVRVVENGAAAEVNAGLVELIKEAFAIRNQLLSGSDDSIEAMSGRLGMDKCRLTQSIDFLTSRRKLSALYSQVDIPLS